MSWIVEIWGIKVMGMEKDGENVGKWNENVEGRGGIMDDHVLKNKNWMNEI